MADLPPQPLPNPDSAGYWEHLARGELAIQRCTACRQWQYPMLERCRRCGGELQLERTGGRGTVHSFIVEHHRVAPGFDDQRPYAIALVALDEAPEVRLSGRVEGANPAEVQIGARVQAEIVELPGGEHRIPVVRLTG